jgi:hypothetical protein
MGCVRWLPTLSVRSILCGVAAVFKLHQVENVDFKFSVEISINSKVLFQVQGESWPAALWGEVGLLVLKGHMRDNCLAGCTWPALLQQKCSERGVSRTHISLSI